MNSNLSEAIDASIHAQLSCKRALALIESLGMEAQVKGLKSIIAMLGKISRQIKALNIEEVKS